MRPTKNALYTSISAFLFAAATIVGCGDDDGGGSGDDTAGAGGAPDKGGSGGSTAARGGTDAKGGTTGKGGGVNGGGDVGGTGNEAGAGGAQGGAGGSDAGAAGSGGAGAAPGGFGPVTEVGSAVIDVVNDLRGLTFAKNGKIYGSGHVGADASVDRLTAIVRFDADGTLDTTFGNDGVVTFNLRERVVTPASNGEGGAGGAGGEGGAGPGEVVVNDGDEQSLGIVELENGDFIVQANVRDAAGKGTDVVLLRVDADGDLVTSFGTDGVQRIDLGWTEAESASFPLSSGPNDQAWGISLDASGEEEKIVVHAFGPAKAGQTTGNPAVQRTDNDRYVVRVLASDGSLDPDFNGGQVFSLNTGGTFADGARRGLVEEDGSILSSGYTNYGDGLGNHIVLIRLTPDGTPDESFGFGIALPGVARSNPFLDDGGVAECYAVGKQSNGRYVTTGYGRATAANRSSSYGWAPTDAVDLVSFGVLPDGIDTTFGRSGTLAIQSEEYALGNTEDRGRDLVVLPDDRIVYVGRFGPHPAIFVTTPDGELDASSGEDGRFLYDPLGANTSHFFRVALSPDGKRIAATTNNHASGVLVAVLEVEDE